MNMRAIYKRIIALATILCFVAQEPGLAQVTVLPAMASRQAGERPLPYCRLPHLRSLDYRADGCSLLYDRGSAKNNLVPLEQSAGILFTHFLVGISLPNSAFWVNLRPDAPDGIIDPALARTDAGTILLEADLQLKKDTARYTSPQTPEGKEYWRRLYAKAETVYGSVPASLPSLARPWIVPGEVIIKQADSSAHVYKAGLDVKLMDDRLSKGSGYDFDDARAAELNAYASGLMRELILPKLAREVNIAGRYAALRQVFYSLVLAQWFKEKFKGAGGDLAERIDTGSLEGIVSLKPCSPEAYFARYRESFRKGEYQVNEHAQSVAGETVRTYVSGGMDFSGIFSGAPSMADMGEGIWRSGKVTVGTVLAEGSGFNGAYLAPAITRGTSVRLTGSAVLTDGGTRDDAGAQTQWDGIMASLRTEVVARVNKERHAANGDGYTELKENFVFDPETLAAFREVLRERYITDPSAPDYKEISKAKHRITPERQRSMNLKTLGKGRMTPGNLGHRLRKFTRPTDREKASLYLIYSHGRGILTRKELVARVEAATGDTLPPTIHFSELRALGLIGMTDKGINKVAKGLFEALYSADSKAGDIKTWGTLFDGGPAKDGGLNWLRVPLDALQREAAVAAGKDISAAFDPAVLLSLKKLLREKYINDTSVFEDSRSSADDFRTRENNFKSLVKTTEARTALWKLLHLIAYPDEETDKRVLRLIYSYGYGDGRALLPEVLARRVKFRIPSSISAESLEFLGLAARSGKNITGVNKANFLALFPEAGQPEAAREEEDKTTQWMPIFDELKRAVVSKLNRENEGGAQRKESDPFDPDSLKSLRQLLRDKYVNDRNAPEYALAPMFDGRPSIFAKRSANLNALRRGRINDPALRELVTLVAYPEAEREQVVLGLLYAYRDYGTRPLPRGELWKRAGITTIPKSINFGLLEYLGLLQKNNRVILGVNRKNFQALYPDIETWSEDAWADGGSAKAGVFLRVLSVLEEDLRQELGARELEFTVRTIERLREHVNARYGKDGFIIEDKLEPLRQRVYGTAAKDEKTVKKEIKNIRHQIQTLVRPDLNWTAQYALYFIYTHAGPEPVTYAVVEEFLRTNGIKTPLEVLLPMQGLQAMGLLKAGFGPPVAGKITAIDQDKFRALYPGIESWKKELFIDAGALADGGTAGKIIEYVRKTRLEKDVAGKDALVKLQQVIRDDYVILWEKPERQTLTLARERERRMRNFEALRKKLSVDRSVLMWVLKLIAYPNEQQRDALAEIHAFKDGVLFVSDLRISRQAVALRARNQVIWLSSALQSLGLVTLDGDEIVSVDTDTFQALYPGIKDWGEGLSLNDPALADGGKEQTAVAILRYLRGFWFGDTPWSEETLAGLPRIINDNYLVRWEAPQERYRNYARGREERLRRFVALRQKHNADRTMLMWLLKLLADPTEQQRDALAEIYGSENGALFVPDLRISRQATTSRERNKVFWLTVTLQSLGLIAQEGDDTFAVDQKKLRALYPDIEVWHADALADGGTQAGWKAVFEILRDKVATEINNQRRRAAKEAGRAEFKELGPDYSFDPETLTMLKQILRDQYINDVTSPDYSLSRAVKGGKSPDKIRAENLKALRKGKIGDAPLRKLLKIIAYPEPEREQPLLYALYSYDYAKNGAIRRKDLPGITGFATPTSFNCAELAYLGLVTRKAEYITGVNRANFRALYKDENSDIDTWGIKDRSISADGGRINREGNLEDLFRKAPKELTYVVDEVMITKEKAKAFFTFDQYMDEALFNPKWGYYTSRPSIGSSRDGYDFSTYPESLSPVFGQMVGARIGDIYRNMREGGLISAGERFEILEFGAGNGTLARDILAYFAATKDPGIQELYQNLRYTIGERSRKLRGIQEARLEPFKKKIRVEPADARDPASFTRKGFKGVVISNELPDAFGTHKVRIGSGYLRDRSFEVCISIPTQNPAVIAATLPRELARKIISGSGDFGLPFHLDTAYISREDFLAAMEYLAEPGREGARQDFVKALRFKEAYIDGADFPEIAEYLSMNEAVINNRLSGRQGPFVVPVNTASAAYMRSVGALLNRRGNTGYAITIDYGGSGEHLLSGRLPPEKMIRCYGQTSIWDDNPYFLPGERDITADINFSYLNRIGESAGLKRIWYGPQGTLYMSGERYMNAAGDKDLRGAAELTQEYAAKFTRFISRTGGFQVLVQSSDAIPADKRYRYPQYGRAAGLPRGAALEPNEMVFIRDEMARDSDMLFDDALEARLEAAGVPDVVELLARIEELAEYHHELTGSLFLFMKYEPEVAQKAVSILSASGLLDFGISRSVSGGRKDGGTAPGGIDLRRIPRMEIAAAVSGTGRSALASFDVEKELAALEVMVDRAMRPSPGRVCDFAVAARGARTAHGRLRDCVAALIRLDEDAAEPTAPELVNLLF